MVTLICIGLPWRMTVKVAIWPAGTAGDLAGQVGGVFHRLAVDGGDDVALLEAGLGGRTTRHDFGDHRALGCP